MQSLTGLWIPLEYLQNQRLTGNERLILSFIRYKQAEEGFQGSNREIGTSLQLKDNRVSEAIVELIKKGFLERIDKNLKTSENWKHSENRKPENIPKNGNINSEKRKLPKSEPYISIQKPNEDDSTKDIQKKETKKRHLRIKSS
jgi:LexA DNA binding domain